MFPNQEISPKAGAYHSAEIPLLFGTSADTGADTVQEVKLSKNMRHAWAEFGKDPENGLVKLGWPVYDQKGEPIRFIGDFVTMDLEPYGTLKTNCYKAKLSCSWAMKIILMLFSSTTVCTMLNALLMLWKH